MRILEVAGLAERAHDPVAILSGGMSRRLNLACAMVHALEPGNCFCLTSPPPALIRSRVNAFL